MDKKEKEIREELGSLSDKMQGIVDKAEEDERELTEEEQKEFDGYKSDWDAQKKKLDNYLALKEAGDFGEAPAGGQLARTEPKVKVKKDQREQEGYMAYQTLRLMNGVAKRNVREIDGAVEELARGGHYGKEVAEKVQRAAGDYYSTLVDADGAHLLPTEVQAGIDTVAGEYGFIRQAATVFNHVKGTIKRGGATGSLKASAIAEGGDFSASKRSFKALELNPKKWGIIMPWSYEADLELAQQILSDAQQALGEGFANAEDDAALNGDGTSSYNSITGVINDTDSKEYVLSGDNTTFDSIEPDDIILARNKVAASLRSGLAYVFHPDMEAVFLTKKDDQGAYIFDYQTQGTVPTLKGRPVFYTEALPDNATESQADSAFGAIGYWPLWQMAIGQGMTTEEMREGIVPDADTGADINLAKQDLRALKVRSLFDMGTNFGDAFCVFKTATSGT